MFHAMWPLCPPGVVEGGGAGHNVRQRGRAVALRAAAGARVLVDGAAHGREGRVAGQDHVAEGQGVGVRDVDGPAQQGAPCKSGSRTGRSPCCAPPAHARHAASCMGREFQPCSLPKPFLHAQVRAMHVVPKPFLAHISRQA